MPCPQARGHTPVSRTDFDELLQKVAFEDAGGNTALIDTIYGSLNQLRSGVHTRKALLVISDGMDNHSRYSREELLQRAVESDAQIYTIAVGTSSPYAKPMTIMEERRGLLFLDELAAKTGGISFIVHNPADIAAAATSIGQALRNQYTIGYVPRGNDRNGQWRRIRVKVADSGLRAYARTRIEPVRSAPETSQPLCLLYNFFCILERGTKLQPRATYVSVHNKRGKVVKSHLGILRGCLAGLTGVALVTFIAFRLHLNLSSSGSLYFLIVVMVSIVWGFWEASVTSLIAVSCLNYFFVPPVFTWTVSDPQNWVALATFEIAALTVSRLSTRAQEKARAEARQRVEVQKLYELSRRILLLDRRQSIGPQIVSLIQEIFRTRSVALFDATSARMDATGSPGRRSRPTRARRLFPGQGAGRRRRAHVGPGAAAGVEACWRDCAPRHGTGPAHDRPDCIAGGHCPGACAFLRKRKRRRSRAPDRAASDGGSRLAGPRVQNAADGDMDGKFGTPRGRTPLPR